MYTINTTDRESLEKELKMLRVSEDGNRRRDGSSTANYRQLHQSLLHLQESADRIFDTISDRTAKEREKLMDLSMRIRNAKGKIDAISGSKKLVTVRSCARYPSNGTVEDFHSLFGYDDGATAVGFPVAKLSLNGGLNREFGDDGTLDLYKFFSEITCGFLPMEVCLERGDLSKRAAFAKNIAETPKFSNSSFLMEDPIAMDSLQDPKNQALPPPPPSLLLHNMNLWKTEKDVESLDPLRFTHIFIYVREREMIKSILHKDILKEVMPSSSYCYHASEMAPSWSLLVIQIYH